MAQIKKHVSKDGKVSYLIRVSDGYGVDGKQRKKSMTWTPPEGMTPARVKKQLQVEAMEFERRVHEDETHDGNIKFEAFAELWMRDHMSKQLKGNTNIGYTRRLVRINQAIGHIRLKDLKTGHINKFYSNLQEEGMRRDVKYRAKMDIAALLDKRKMTRKDCFELCGVSEFSLRRAIRRDNISEETATAIAKGLGVSLSRMFDEVAKKGDKLEASTVRAYHVVLSSILAKAVKWGYISTNPATNAELPKMDGIEATSMDKEEVKRMIALLYEEPIKYRAPLLFDLYSGLRRGELLGLRWEDVDFENEMITVTQTSNYMPHQGLYTDTPKTKSSARSFRLTSLAFMLLQTYKEWQDEMRNICGNLWQDKDGRVFTTEEGRPLRPNTLGNWFRDFTARNGFEGVHIHTLRHTFASMAIAGGTDINTVSHRLGHQHTSTTLDIYTHAMREADERAARVMDEFADVVPMHKPMLRVVGGNEK